MLIIEGWNVMIGEFIGQLVQACTNSPKRLNMVGV